MRITFEAKGFAPLEVESDAALADCLDGPHSPVFFGCKSGNCGTCLVEVNPESKDKLAPPSSDEQYLLDAHSGENPNARLACQLKASCDLHLKYLN